MAAVRLRQRRSALPLRVSLVAATLALVAISLVVQGYAVTMVVRDRMISRIDQNLLDATRGWAQIQPREQLPPLEGPNLARPPSNYFVRNVEPDGRIWTVINDNHAEPALPPDNDVGPEPTTVESIDDPTIHWRAVSTRGTHGELITVARDISDVRATIRFLNLSRLGIAVAVLLVLGTAAYLVVNRSLRPLAEVEQTAAAIAGGQFDRRIPQRDPRTEVGRLSLALNGMLAQIQRAMAASDASAECARSSEERMRRFIADASHELRTPLTTIRGFAELYRQGATQDVELLMSRIEGEAQRMGVLVDDLLLLARLDAQRPLDRSRVDLLVLATDAVHDARAIDPHRNVTLEILDGPGTPEVLGDEPRLRQILSNLMMNAIEHTPTDVTITVRVGTERSAAVLEVADDGPGMAEEDAARIFQRFYRTDSSRARASGGVGLGLPIVDALARAHGGKVSLTTALGNGCCFRVTMPRLTERTVMPAAK